MALAALNDLYNVLAAKPEKVLYFFSPFKPLIIPKISSFSR